MFVCGNGDDGDDAGGDGNGWISGRYQTRVSVYQLHRAYSFLLPAVAAALFVNFPLMVKVAGKSLETNMFKLLYKDIKYFVYLNNIKWNRIKEETANGEA